MSNIDYLKEIPFFREIGEENLTELNNISKIRHLKKGTILFIEGNKAESIFIVKNGKIKISKISSVGKEYIIKIMESGDIFAESTLFIGGEYPATAEVVEDAQVVEIKNSDIENLILKNSVIALSIIKLMAKRLKNIAVIIENLALKDSIGRTASVLLTFAKERGISTKEGILVEIELKRQELANLVGTSRENISRNLSQMDKDGIISLSKDKILIRDLEKLRNLF
ncbi:MAG: Crp/Fnr family transcriptional regulator [Thermoanaerobacteraceae bacterium]